MVRGTGAPVTLTGAEHGRFTGGTATVAVDTTVQADYRPVTGTVRGRVGDTVRVRLGVRDLGPGRPRGDEETGRFEVVPPEGTTVTSVPYSFEDSDREWGCERPERTGGAFVCDIGGDAFSWAREDDGTTAIDFLVRIDRQVPGARGTIRTYNPYDRTPGNDTAVIPLDASPSPAYRSLSRPGIWAAVAAGGVTAGAVVAVYRRRRGVAADS
ncbi:hypothetical protein [Streptomyces sp. NPDC057287]|uniref:hypothetical protein n=1 Tax=Streptomyces sp. NPDC057287 TaxID=3346086 RepID=UPI00362EA148